MPFMSAYGLGVHNTRRAFALGATLAGAFHAAPGWPGMDRVNRELGWMRDVGLVDRMLDHGVG